MNTIYLEILLFVRQKVTESLKMLLQNFIDIGDTAWILAATCLVLIMTPGLAMFYGGLLRKKNVLSMFAFCFMAMFAGSIAWVLLGYSFAFGNGTGFIGDFSFLGMQGILDYSPVGSIPASVFAIFQCMFVLITAGILASPFADRTKLASFGIFIFLWVLLIYSPIAHWVWGEGGFLLELGALDFAGGTVVHVNVGFAALAVALIIKPRKGYQKEEMKPHNIPMVLVGLGLVWFGWFGFNGGSALGANATAGLAIINTNIAACTAAITWMIIEKVKGNKISTIGIATGVLAGLIGVTPSAGLVEPWAASLIGIITTLPVYFAVQWRNNSKIDESLDAFACHGVGGSVGVILTGVFASINGGTSLITGDFAQFGTIMLSIIVTAAYSFVGTAILALVVKKVFGLRVSVEEEVLGLDASTHGESAYDHADIDYTQKNEETENIVKLAPENANIVSIND